MATETERKFLVKDTRFLAGITPVSIVQGYLHDNGPTSRVRIADGTQAWLTLKGRRDKRLNRPEFEYPIPLEDAVELLAMCEDRIVRKQRYEIVHAGDVWHVDVYAGEVAGLVTAELELSSYDQLFKIPRWVGHEVTHDKRFTNKRLACDKRVPLRLAA